MEKLMIEKWKNLGFAEKFFVGVILVGVLSNLYNWIHTSSNQSNLLSAQEKCFKEAEELKATALPHEYWKKAPPVCDSEGIEKLASKTPGQLGVINATQNNQEKKPFPNILWFLGIAVLPLIVRFIKQTLLKEKTPTE